MLAQSIPDGAGKGGARWVMPHRQVLLFAGLCALWFLVRLVGATALKIDDSLETYRSQSLEWVYAPANPPLYTWLLAGLQELFGTGLHASMLLNYALLIGTFTCVLLSARRVLGADGDAALAAWSLLLIRQFTRANFTMTHSILLMFLCALAFWSFLKLLDNPRPGLSFGLGVALGLGLLSKFNFVAFIACLMLAACFQARTRAVLAPPLALWLLAGLLAVAGPYAVAYALAGFDIVGVVTVRIDTASATGYFARLLSGLSGAGIAVAAFLGVLTAAVMASAPGGAVRAAVSAVMGRREPVQAGDPVLLRLVRDVLLVALALILLGVLTGTVTRVSERYLHPFLLVPAPILAVAWLRAAGGAAGPWGTVEAGRRARKRFAALIGCFGLGVLLLLILELSPLCPQACRDQTPYAGLAEALREAGYDGAGTIVAGSPIIAGNLRDRFDATRVWLAGSPYEPPLRTGGPVQGQCLLVWQEADGGSVAPPPEALAYARLDPVAAAALTRRIMVPSARPFLDWGDVGAGLTHRPHYWRFLLVERGPETGRCR